KAFSRVFKMAGALGKLIFFGFSISTGFTVTSICVGAGFGFAAGGDEVFFGFGGAVFAAGFDFGNSFGFVSVFTHSRKVMSSRAKSLPQPPGALSIINNCRSDVFSGVVNSTRC